MSKYVRVSLSDVSHGSIGYLKVDKEYIPFIVQKFNAEKFSPSLTHNTTHVVCNEKLSYRYERLDLRSDGQKVESLPTNRVYDSAKHLGDGSNHCYQMTEEEAWERSIYFSDTFQTAMTGDWFRGGLFDSRVGFVEFEGDVPIYIKLEDGKKKPFNRKNKNRRRRLRNKGRR